MELGIGVDITEKKLDPSPRDCIAYHTHLFGACQAIIYTKKPGRPNSQRRPVQRSNSSSASRTASAMAAPTIRLC